MSTFNFDLTFFLLKFSHITLTPHFFSPDEEIGLTLRNIKLGIPQSMLVSGNDGTIRLHLPTTVTDTGGLMVGVPMRIALPKKIGEQGVECTVVHQLVAEYSPSPEVSVTRHHVIMRKRKKIKKHE